VFCLAQGKFTHLEIAIVIANLELRGVFVRRGHAPGPRAHAYGHGHDDHESLSSIDQIAIDRDR